MINYLIGENRIDARTRSPAGEGSGHSQTVAREQMGEAMVQVREGGRAMYRRRPASRSARCRWANMRRRSRSA